MNYNLTISCDKDNLARVRHFVAEILQNNEFKEIEAHKLVLAVDEIIANLIIHSNQCNPTKKIDVVVEMHPFDRVIFIIKDKGVSFDIRDYSEPTMDEIIASKRKGGVGLMLVKRIMDKIEFSTEKNYNICRLTKILNK